MAVQPENIAVLREGTLKSSALVRGRMVTLNECALIFGVADNTVRRWVAKGCPVIEKGNLVNSWKLSTADVSSWLVNQKKASGENGEDLDAAKLRKMTAEADLAEMDAAVKRGELVPINDVAAAVADQFSACRAKLFSLPVKLAPVVAAASDANEVRDLLEGAMREAVDELIGYDASKDGGADRETPGETADGDAGESEAAAEDDGFTMGGPDSEAVV